MDTRPTSLADFLADFGRQLNEAVEHGQEFNIEPQVSELNSTYEVSNVVDSNSTTSLMDGNPSKRETENVSEYLIFNFTFKYFLLKGEIRLEDVGSPYAKISDKPNTDQQPTTTLIDQGKPHLNAYFFSSLIIFYLI